MREVKYIFLILFATMAFLSLASVTMALEKCVICHGKHDLVRTEETGRQVSLFVPDSALANTVHADRECTDCHDDIVEIPHQKPAKVNCRRCHYTGNPLGAPGGEIGDQYEHSVHGIEVLAGNEKAPVCADCHGTHDIYSPSKKESTVYKQNSPRTCGKCHIDVYATYRESIHGTALADGILDSPDCVSCHGEHNISRHSDADSKVIGSAIVKTCSECHNSVGVASKYGIKSDRVSTVEHSFHGVATEIGNQTVANCASCHDYHDIRPSSDPKSAIHPDNIMATCGRTECHPEATLRFASGQIHIDPMSEESGILYYITKFFTILTVSTLVGLLLLILMDLYRRAKTARDKRKR